MSHCVSGAPCRLMPALLSILEDRRDLLSHEVYLLSAVTALQHVTETLLHFISPYLQDATAQVGGRGGCLGSPLTW